MQNILRRSGGTRGLPLIHFHAEHFHDLLPGSVVRLRYAQDREDQKKKRADDCLEETITNPAATRGPSLLWTPPHHLHLEKPIQAHYVDHQYKQDGEHE